MADGRMGGLIGSIATPCLSSSISAKGRLQRRQPWCTMCVNSSYVTSPTAPGSPPITGRPWQSAHLPICPQTPLKSRLYTIAGVEVVQPTSTPGRPDTKLVTDKSPKRNGVPARCRFLIIHMSGMKRRGRRTIKKYICLSTYRSLAWWYHMG